jgi:tetratricopeptide (TPR) repeat protein
MSAYDYLLQGREHWNHYDAIAAEVPLRRAIDLDPNYAQAHAWLGLSLLLKSHASDDELRLEPALACAQRAVDLDPDDSMTQAILAQVLTHMRKHDAAVVHFERAISLNPNNMFAQTLYAALATFMGEPEAALARLNVVLQRDPYPPLWYWEWYGMALYQLRRYDDSLAAFHKMGLRHPWAHGYLAAGNAMAGRLDDAAEHMAAYCKLVPNNSVRKWAKFEPYKDQASLDHLVDGLRKAGLPE